MRTLSPSTVRKLSSVLLIVIIGLAAAFLFRDYQSTRANANIRAHTAAHLVSTQFGWVMEASRQALNRIGDSALFDGEGTSQDVVADINKAVRDLPSGYQYSAYGPNGRLIYSSIPGAVGITISDRNYFQTLISGDDIAVSSVLHEKLSGDTVFIVGRRIEKDGRLLGVATIAIPVSTLTEVADSLGLSGRSTVSLIRADGMLIARSPSIEAVDLSNAVVFQELRQSDDGVYSSTSPVDGVERIVGYWKIPGWPVIAIAAIDRQEAMKPFRQTLEFWAILALPALLALIFVIFRLIRHMETEARQQAELVAAHSRNEFLLREIHHRVKNNLQTVMSLIRLDRNSTGNPDNLLGRVAAMVAAHEEMYRYDQFETVRVAPFMKRLAGDIVHGYGRPVEITYDIDDLELAGDRAMQLGLLTNELISNAFKHAWNEGEGGELLVALKDDGRGGLTLTVKDNGRGMPDNPNDNMGSRLVRAFSQQLGGELTIENDGGTRVTVVFPKDIARPEDHAA